jgi:hypothetical protein
MLPRLWGTILLLVLLGAYGIGIASAYYGYFLPPLQKTKRFVRQDSRHYRAQPYRGVRRGGGFRGGK